MTVVSKNFHYLNFRWNGSIYIIMHRKIIKESNIFQSKLSRKIIFWIFVSLMIIETIILIPSVQKREKDLVLQDRDVIYGKISWILMAYPEISGSEFLDHIKKLKINSNLNSILGATIYDENGILVAQFGTEKKSIIARYN